MNRMLAKRYSILKNIGHGGMADVYLAKDTLLNREVAIKVLRGELCSDPISLLRFKREAQASCTLIHPNIVEIYDVGEEAGQHFIVMEYIQGQTLKEMIIKRGALLKEEAVDIMKQLVSATCEAHKKGIIHRDIKPQNVIVKADGSIKMLDFGIALAHDALQLTQSDSVLGSVHYLAPEIARGENASYQSDIYALGLVFYELLSGDVPFKGETPVQIALKHMRDEIPSIKEFIPNLPQSLENIILRSTVKRKEFRYESAIQMYKDFETALSPSRLNDRKLVFKFKDEQSNTKPVEKQSLPKTRKKTKKKQPVYAYLIWAMLTCLGVIGVVLVLFFTTGFNESKKIIVPSCEGLNVTQCKELLINNKLSFNASATSFEITDDIEEGIIIHTIPSANEEVKVGTSVEVVVSSGMYQVMKNYVGMNNKVALADIETNYSNIRVKVIEEESIGSTPGIILRQELLVAGDKFSNTKQTDMNLVIASYPNFQIPSTIKAMDIDEAKSLLEESGAKILYKSLEIPDDPNQEFLMGVVVKTEPSIGSWYTQEEENYITIYYY